MELDYIETPINPNRVGRAIKMPNSKSTNAPEVKAPKAKYSKTRGEHFKDIVIAVLVAGIVAFVGGMQFQGNQQHQIDSAVKGAQTVNQAPVKK